jgi:hypothetical protein
VARAGFLFSETHRRDAGATAKRREKFFKVLVDFCARLFIMRLSDLF